MIDVADKAKGVLILKEMKCTDSSGELVSVSTQNVFIRGLGGFGDKGTMKTYFFKKPQRKADLIVTEFIKPNTSILFRVNGDWNPIHIDPDRAHLGGYKKPILHGLCSFGTMGRIIYDNFCKGEPLNLKKLYVRYTSVIFPGETLCISFWKEGLIVVFEVKVKQRNKVAIIGQAEIRERPKL